MEKVLKTILVSVLLASAVGCAKETGAVQPNPNDPYATCASRGNCPTATGTPLPPGSTPAPAQYGSGGTAQLIVNGSALNRMFFESNPNNPQNVQINIDVRRQNDSVLISYTENGYPVQARLGIVHPYSGHVNNQYNGWVHQDGKLIYKAFFQDSHGAIVLIIDKTTSQGDGQPGLLGGEVWFQNFNRYYPNNPQQGPLKMCWEIQMGPYDCRTFLVNDWVVPTSSYYPNNKGPNANTYYEKLGTFSGISRDAAGL